MRYIIGPLKGEEELWVVFWIHLMLVSMCVIIAKFTLALHPLGLPSTLETILTPIGVVADYIYTLWVNISLWQCAPNTESKSAPAMVRIGVVITLIFLIISLVMDIGGGSLLPQPDASDPETEQLRKILEILQKQQ